MNNYIFLKETILIIRQHPPGHRMVLPEKLQPNPIAELGLMSTSFK